MNYSSVVIDQHALAASVLWLRRQSAVVASHTSLRDLETLDNQLDGNLEGLLLADDAGWEHCEAELKWKDAGDFFRATVLALHSNTSDRLDRIQHQVDNAPELRNAVASACGWVPREVSSRFVGELLSSEDAFWREAGMFAYFAWQANPGKQLIDWLNDTDEACRSLAARMVGSIACNDLLVHVQDLCSDTSPTVRMAALETLALRRPTKETLDELESIVASPDQTGTSEQVDYVLATTLPTDRSIAILDRMRDLGCSSAIRRAIQLSAALGIPANIPWLIELVDQPTYARFAGSAISQITGLRLDQQPYETSAPFGFDTGPTDDPGDDNVDLDPDENLPWIEKGTILAWWSANEHRFASEQRYLLGFRLDDSRWLSKVLAMGRQRERLSAAVELALRQSDIPIFGIRLHAREQMKRLGLSKTPTEDRRCTALSLGPN